MSQLLTEVFDTYLGRIELNPDRVNLASTRYNAVKTVVEEALPGSTVHQIGSFQRRTKIRPLGLGDGLDLDLVVALGTATHYAPAGGDGLTPSAAQDKLFRVLRSNTVYRVMNPQRDAPTVLLKYADRDGFTLELVPAFIEKTGKYPRAQGPACYIIAGAGGAWIPADYDYDAAMITGFNKSTAVQGSLVPLIKMAKAYFRATEWEWRSFYIDLAAGRLVPPMLEEWEAKNLRWNYWHAFAGFLERLPTVMRSPIALPGSFSPPANSGIAANKIDRAVDFVTGRAVEAWRLTKLENEQRAFQGWREFFGDPFPASLYG